MYLRISRNVFQTCPCYSCYPRSIKEIQYLHDTMTASHDHVSTEDCKRHGNGQTRLCLESIESLHPSSRTIETYQKALRRQWRCRCVPELYSCWSLPCVEEICSSVVWVVEICSMIPQQSEQQQHGGQQNASRICRYRGRITDITSTS